MNDTKKSDELKMKVSAAAERLNQLRSEREGVLDSAADGDPAAVKRLRVLGGDIADAESILNRLEKKRDTALAAEQSAERSAKLDAMAGVAGKSKAAAVKAVDTIASAVQAITAAMEELTRARSDLRSSLNAVPGCLDAYSSDGLTSLLLPDFGFQPGTLRDIADRLGCRKRDLGAVDLKTYRKRLESLADAERDRPANEARERAEKAERDRLAAEAYQHLVCVPYDLDAEPPAEIIGNSARAIHDAEARTAAPIAEAPDAPVEPFEDAARVQKTPQVQRVQHRVHTDEFAPEMAL